MPIVPSSAPRIGINETTELKKSDIPLAFPTSDAADHQEATTTNFLWIDAMFSRSSMGPSTR
jgi:hypothetical protein